MVHSQVASVIYFFLNKENKKKVYSPESSMSRETQWKIQKRCCCFFSIYFESVPSIKFICQSSLMINQLVERKEGHEESPFELTTKLSISYIWIRVNQQYYLYSVEILYFFISNGNSLWLEHSHNNI